MRRKPGHAGFQSILNYSTTVWLQRPCSDPCRSNLPNQGRSPLDLRQREQAFVPKAKGREIGAILDCSTMLNQVTAAQETYNRAC